LRAILAVGALAVAISVAPVMAGSALAASAPGTAKGTVITTAVTPFGKALVVGSGKYAGFSLYFITSDHGTSFGCTATPVKTPVGTLLCTGPSNDANAEWPAITTTGKPVAAGGVSQKLLGTVTRKHVGVQITYAGHPLYLFDSGPGQVIGEGWDEPSLPPWHGVWDLIQPSGLALPWSGTLTTTTIGGKEVLATPMLTGVGWINFPVYTYSKDSSSKSTCTSACARYFPPVLTSGTPGVSGGASERKVGTLWSAEGLQVKYNGKPLYLFSLEGLAPTSTGYGATGSGNGVKYNGGTFKLVLI
jgi:predicted lipoprotein with Yx(FWY)xxD motif